MTIEDAYKVEIAEKEMACELCDFQYGACKWSLRVSSEHMGSHFIPGPSCPGPAPEGHEYVLVLRRNR